MTQADAYKGNSHGSAAGHGDGHGAHGGHGHGDGEPHVLPLSVYFAVWGALVVLTAVTVAVSRFDFGSANTVIAMLVATVKGSLVALFFMHLFYDNKLNLIILVASLVFVSIFFTPVLIDLSSRGALDSVKTRAGYKLATTPPSLLPTPPPETPEASTAPAPAAPEHGAAPAAPTQAAPAAPEHGAAPAAAPAQGTPAQGAPAQGSPVQGSSPSAPAPAAVPSPVH